MVLPALWLVLDAGPGALAEEAERLAYALRDELLELDVVSVDLAPGDPGPAGAKGPAGVDAGTLVVALSNSAVLVAVAGVLKSWTGRAAGRKITVRFGKEEDTVEVSGASKEDVTGVLESWAARHGQR